MGFCDSNIIDYLWKVSWQTAIVAGIVWGVTRLCQKAPASWRYGLWLLVLLKFCMPPLVHLPSNAVLVPSERPSTVSAPQPNATTAQPTTISGSEPMGMAQSAESTPITGHQLPLVDFWLLGLIVFGIVLIARLFKQSNLIRTSEELKDNAIDGLLIDCASKIGLRNLPSIKISAKIRIPMLVGSIRPCILLPKGMGFNEEFRAILLHELSHIKRDDILTVWLYELVKLAFYFHPALWLAGHELKKERELACDEKVLAISGIDRKDYASGYVSALKMANSAAKMPLALGMAEPFEVEKRRLERILHRPIPKYTWAWALGILIIGIIMLPTIAGIVKGDNPYVMDNPPNIEPPLSVELKPKDPSFTKKVQLAKPVELAINGTTYKVTSIGRVNETPLGKKAGYLVLCAQPVGSSGKLNVVPDYPVSLGSYNGANSFAWLSSKRDTLLLYYKLQPTGSPNTIESLEGNLRAITTIQGRKSFGPYSIDRAKKPIAYDSVYAAMKVADVQLVEFPRTYLPLRPGKKIGAIHSNDREGSKYLMLRSYWVAQDYMGTVSMDVKGRDGSVINLNLESGSGPLIGPPSMTSRTTKLMWNTPIYFGFQGTPVTPQMKKERGYADGFLVLAVDPNGPAVHAECYSAEPTTNVATIGHGIKPGDVITQFGGIKGEMLGSFSTSLNPKNLTVVRMIGRTAYSLKFTLTPIEDPMFADMDASKNDSWKDILSHYKRGLDPRGMFKLAFISDSPVAADFDPVSISFTAGVGGRTTKNVHYKLQNIPIPSEIWQKG